MRILITNDDSVSASQLVPLIRWFQKVGDVTVVVPKVEQSAKSHGINIHHPFEVVQRELEPGLTVWTVDSTPADCVRYAVLGMKMEFDLVISGINRGYNVGKDIMYSGTVAAISEAVAIGIPGIALSTSPEYYPHAVKHLDMVWAYVQEHKLLEKHNFYNINIPEDPTAFSITHQGGPYYSDDYVSAGGDMVVCSGKCVHVDKGDMNLDTDAVMHNTISITPMTVDRTAMDIYSKLKNL